MDSWDTLEGIREIIDKINKSIEERTRFGSFGGYSDWEMGHIDGQRTLVRDIENVLNLYDGDR